MNFLLHKLMCQDTSVIRDFQQLRATWASVHASLADQPVDKWAEELKGVAFNWLTGNDAYRTELFAWTALASLVRKGAKHPNRINLEDQPHAENLVKTLRQIRSSNAFRAHLEEACKAYKIHPPH